MFYLRSLNRFILISLLVLTSSSAQAISVLLDGTIGQTTLGSAAAANGFSFSTTNLTSSTDLSGVDILAIVQGSGVPDAATATLIANFVSAGGGLFVELGGSCGNNHSWVPTAGVTGSLCNSPNSENIGIVETSSVIVSQTTDAELDNWGQSGHGEYLATGGLDIILQNDDTGNPVLLAGLFGLGRVIYSQLDATCCETSGHGAGLGLVTGSLAYLAGGTPSAVPVPAAVWLFGTAMIGLVGFGKRKARIAA